MAARGAVEERQARTTPSTDGVAVLWQIRFSHFNEKARWALDYKGVPHRRRSALPGLHVLVARRLYGGDTFPVLVLDGEAIGGSDKIIAALEERQPEPPLFPEHEIQHRLALELEQYFGTELGPHLRRYLFFHALPQTGDASAFFSEGFSYPARLGYRFMFPVGRIGMRKAMRIDEEGAELGRRKTLAALDRVESELGSSGYLVGDGFSVADLTAAALFFPIVRPPERQYPLPDRWPEPVEEFRSSIADRDGFKWVEEMWRRHRGVSAEVAG